MLNPNFPIMATQGAHPDSFPDTKPFNFNSATYFIPMTSMMGIAFASLFMGQLSDKMGRKPIMLVLSVVSTAGSIVKYFTRNTFWAFCISNFLFGFFLGNLPVAMAYIGDIFENKAEKEKQLGILVGVFVLGNSGGGVIAILMENSGLFAPLWVGAAITGIASVLIAWYLIEPGDARLIDKHQDTAIEDDEDEVARPAEINNVVMWNVLIGALLDNIGSVGLAPLCLSPLALEHFTLDFVNAGEEPMMSITGYKWFTVCLALTVIPSALVTPRIFANIGVAATCVMGNILTGCLTIALLFIGNGPAKESYFITFVCVLYVGFPFTVFSQLTTGPMLDCLAPVDKLGYVQGLNSATMNLGSAFAPWVLGLLADSTSTNTAIWTGVGVSFAAALCNVPLIFQKGMGKPEAKEPVYRRVLEGEDEEIARKAIDGDFIHPEQFFEINLKRLHSRKPFIVPKVRSYEAEKDSLRELAQYARENFEFRKDMGERILCAIDEGKEDAVNLCELINIAHGRMHDSEAKKEAQRDLGEWISDYLEGNGYHPYVNSILIKQMVLTAFPSITTEKEITPDNIETAVVRFMAIILDGLTVRKDPFSLTKILGGRSSGTRFYN